MLCSSSLSSCHSLWSTGKLLSLEKPSNPLLHSVSASHHQEWEAGPNSQPVSLSCCSPGAKQLVLPGCWPARQKAWRDKQSSTNNSPLWCITLALIQYPVYYPEYETHSCFSTVKRNLDCEGGSFSGSKPSQECQATWSPALICWHVCTHLGKTRLGNSSLQLITYKCRNALNTSPVCSISQAAPPALVLPNTTCSSRKPHRPRGQGLFCLSLSCNVK